MRFISRHCLRSEGRRRDNDTHYMIRSKAPNMPALHNKSRFVFIFQIVLCTKGEKTSKLIILDQALAVMICSFRVLDKAASKVNLEMGRQ